MAAPTRCPAGRSAPRRTDRHGSPFAVTFTGGNRHGATHLLLVLDAVPPIRVGAARTPSQADVCTPTGGYDFENYRRRHRLLWKRGIKSMNARRGVAHRSGLGKVRWVVERTFAWLHQFKRLRTRRPRA